MDENGRSELLFSREDVKKMATEQFLDNAEELVRTGRIADARLLLLIIDEQSLDETTRPQYERLKLLLGDNDKS